MVDDSLRSNPDIQAFAGRPYVTIDDPALRRFKPDPQAYLYLAKTFQKENDLSSVWLVSSNPFDVVGARSAGLNAAWIDRSEKGWVDALGTPTEIVNNLGDFVNAIELAGSVNT